VLGKSHATLATLVCLLIVPPSNSNNNLPLPLFNNNICCARAFHGTSVRLTRRLLRRPPSPFYSQRVAFRSPSLFSKIGSPPSENSETSYRFLTICRGGRGFFVHSPAFPKLWLLSANYVGFVPGVCLSSSHGLSFSSHPPLSVFSPKGVFTSFPVICENIISQYDFRSDPTKCFLPAQYILAVPSQLRSRSYERELLPFCRPDDLVFLGVRRLPPVRGVKRASGGKNSPFDLT